MKRLLRDPLVHFLALGAGLFLLFGAVGNRVGDKSDRIIVTSGQIEQLVVGWQRTWRRPPTTKELDGLIDDYIVEEILYREALALGLDRDDTIVRRRLRQKMEFITEDLAAAVEPTEAELQEYLNKNPDAFRIDPRMTFHQIYLSRERRGAAVEEDAKRLLAELGEADRHVQADTMGDPFLLPSDFESLPKSEVTKLFGAEFAEQLTSVEPGQWAGPIESGYGMHLVFVRERHEGRVPELAEVREAVQREWLDARRKKAKEAFYRQLRERYTVTVERPASLDENAQQSRRDQ